MCMEWEINLSIFLKKNIKMHIFTKKIFMKKIYYYSFLLTFLLVSKVTSQSLDANLLELKFSNDGYPEKMTKVQNGFYFSSEDDQLWFSDGTVENTVLIKDFDSGLYDDISSLTPVGTKVFFVAENGSDNRELWVSDGTEVGTIQLTDRNVGFSTESIYDIIEFNDKIYFGAYSEVYGFELWVSDGTPAGTFVLKDIAGTDNSSNPSDFFVFNDKLFFKAYTEEFGKELWVSDGTSDGTILFKDINVGPNSGSNSQGYITFNQNFYFFADNGTTGSELWKSDGTSGGTLLLKDIRAGNLSSYNELKGSVLNDKLIFAANDGINGNEIWETNGTLEGTTLFKDINIGAGSGISYDGRLNLVGDKIFFNATNGSNESGLWVTDGTSQNTFFLNEAAPNLLSGNSTGTFAIYFVNDVLWKSDGTINGTTILSEDIQVTNISVSDQSYLAYGNSIFFNGENKANGNELWITDGTIEGTKLFFDVNHRYGVNPSLLTAVGDKLFFRGNKYGYFGLCTSDGTIEGTKYLNIGSNEGGIDDESEFIDFNGKLIVSAHDGVHGFELWISDGTQEGTFMVKDINPGNASSMLNSNIYSSFAVFNNKLYFQADDGTGLGLWTSDGTSNGTYKISKPEVEVLIGHNGSTFFTIFGEDVYYFGKKDGLNGLYKIDASTNENIYISSFVQIEHMYVTDNKLFIIQDSGSTRQLWVVNGTTETASYLLDFADDRIDHFAIFKNEFYFNARIYGSADRALYKSDGTVGGTVPVFTNSNLPVTTYPMSKNLISCGEYLYFGIKNSSGTISELWRTDGTTSGTVSIVNEVNGVFNSIDELSCFKETLFFKQWSNEFDFWTTSGVPNTAVGFNLNVTNGPIQSIYNFTPIENKLFFYGQTEESGAEIYVTYPETVLSIENNLVLNGKDKLNALLYPNPSKGVLNIKISNNLINFFEIFNMSGKKVITKRYKEFKKEINLNIGTLSSGIYLIKINTNNNEQVVSKFIVN